MTYGLGRTIWDAAIRKVAASGPSGASALTINASTVEIGGASVEM